MYPTIETADREVYKAGKFTFYAEGCLVVVTSDTKTGIQTINVHEYKNHEAACEAAWKMATRQMRA